ncbi:MAG TPA: C-terminal helicase domain-containing protein, partial [Cellulomonas sp.]
VADELVDRGFAAGALHGDLGQGAREQALRAFRNGKVDVLVATDVAARGIDVDDVTHVVNYQCPEDEKTYLHRTGRTGRAGHKGTAVTFVDWDDVPRWSLIDKALGLGIPSPVETYSTSPHLFEDLTIPAGTTGRLPRSRRTREGLDAETLEDLGETGKRHASAVRGGRDGGRDSGRDGRGHGGDRDRGDRGDRGGEQRGGRDGDRPARQRTRRTGSGAPDAVAPAGTTAPASTSENLASTGPAEGREEGAAPRRRRNRRRTRGGAGSGAAAEGTSAPAPTEG